MAAAKEFNNAIESGLKEAEKKALENRKKCIELDENYAVWCEVGDIIREYNKTFAGTISKQLSTWNSKVEEHMIRLKGRNFDVVQYTKWWVAKYIEKPGKIGFSWGLFVADNYLSEYWVTVDKGSKKKEELDKLRAEQKERFKQKRQKIKEEQERKK